MGILEVGQSGIVVSGVEGVVGMMSGKLGDVRYVFFVPLSIFPFSCLVSSTVCLLRPLDRILPRPDRELLSTTREWGMNRHRDNVVGPLSSPVTVCRSQSSPSSHPTPLISSGSAINSLPCPRIHLTPYTIKPDHSLSHLAHSSTR